MVQPKEKLTLANINQVNNGMFSFYLYNRYGNIVGRGVVALVYLIDHAFTDWNLPGLYIGGHSLIILFRALSTPVWLFWMIRLASSISTKICGCLMAVERIKYLSRFTHSFG